MLSEALQWLRELSEEATTPAIETIDGGIYHALPDGTLERIAEAQSRDRLHSFLDLRSLADYCSRFDEAVAADSVVLVGPGGICAVLAESDARRNDRLTVPLYTSGMPSTSRMAFEDLLLFLDRHDGAIVDEQALRDALHTVRVVQSEEVMLADKGASVELRTKGSRGVEGATATIPKWVVIRMTYGDSAFSADLRFRLRVRIAGNGVDFELQHVEEDGSLEEWMDSAIDRLRIAMPQWTICAGQA